MFKIEGQLHLALGRFDDVRVAQLDREIEDLDESARLLRAALRDRTCVIQSPLLFATIVHAISQHSAIVDEVHATDALDRFGRNETGRDVIEGWVAQLDAAKATKVIQRDKLASSWRSRFRWAPRALPIIHQSSSQSARLWGHAKRRAGSDRNTQA